jgi:hypothetical protein
MTFQGGIYDIFRQEDVPAAYLEITVSPLLPSIIKLDY